MRNAALNELAGVKGRLTKCRADLQAALDVDEVPVRPGWQGLAILKRTSISHKIDSFCT